MIRVKIEETLKVDDTAAELLNALSSARFTRAVFRALPLSVTAGRSVEELIEALNSIHCQTARMIRQRDAALRAIRDYTELPPRAELAISH